MPPTFCGNPPAPNGKVMGTSYECLRKGVGVGKYLLANGNGNRSIIPWYIYLIIGLLLIILTVLLIFYFTK